MILHPNYLTYFAEKKFAKLQRKLNKLKEERNAIEREHKPSARAYKYLIHIASDPHQFTNAEHAWITLQQSRNRKRYIESTECLKLELDAMIKGVEAEMEIWRNE